MRRKQHDGSAYEPALDATVNRNQDAMVDALTNPNPNRMSEMIGNPHKIVSTVPAYNVEAQPVQARGRIVWNDAYAFQAKGPSFLDGSDR